MASTQRAWRAPVDIEREAGAPSRRLRIEPRRRELPGRRALLGAFLVTAAAVLAYSGARQGDDGPSIHYVVASRDLPPGEVLTAADLAEVAVELPPAMAAGAFGQTAALLGAVTLGPVGAGSLLTAAIVDTTGVSGDPSTAGRYREVSFAIPRARALAGRIVAGDRVDVLAALDEHTEILVERALVLQTSAPQAAMAVSDDVVLTLALPDGRDVLAVADGAAFGELTVVRSTRATDRLARAAASPASTAGTSAGGAS